jgi:hypothetical protein
MQASLELPRAVPPSEKPILDSYDSAEECSFYHWIELCKLVDESDGLEIEELVEVTASEV